MTDDPFEGIPPFNPSTFNPLTNPPPTVVVEKIMAAASEARANLNESQLKDFDLVLSVLSSMGFGAMLMLQAGDEGMMNVGEILGIEDKALLAFVHFAATLSSVGIETLVPKDHEALKIIGMGQVQVLMGLLVGYKLRQEQEG